MQNRPEFLFAHWAIPALKDLRGPRWRALVEHVAPLAPTHPDALAFALMMVCVDGCVTCDARRYRAAQKEIARATPTWQLEKKAA